MHSSHRKSEPGKDVSPTESSQKREKGGERNEERVSKLKRKSLTVTSLSVTVEKKDLSRLLKSTCLY